MPSTSQGRTRTNTLCGYLRYGMPVCYYIIPVSNAGQFFINIEEYHIIEKRTIASLHKSGIPRLYSTVVVQKSSYSDFEYICSWFDSFFIKKALEYGKNGNIPRKVGIA